MKLFTKKYQNLVFVFILQYTIPQAGKLEQSGNTILLLFNSHIGKKWH